MATTRKLGRPGIRRVPVNARGRPASLVLSQHGYLPNSPFLRHGGFPVRQARILNPRVDLHRRGQVLTLI